MTLEQALMVLSILLTLYGGRVTYLLKVSEKHEAGLRKLEDQRTENLEKRIEALSCKIDDCFPAALTERVRQIELRHESMHTWKNTMLPRELERLSENLYNVVNSLKTDVNVRLDKHEQKLERLVNGLK